MGCLVDWNSYFMTKCIPYYPLYCTRGKSERRPARRSRAFTATFPLPKRSPNSPSSLAVRGCADGRRQSKTQVRTPRSNPPERDRGPEPRVRCLSDFSQVGVRHRRRGLEVEQLQLGDTRQEQDSALRRSAAAQCVRPRRHLDDQTFQQLRQLSHSRIAWTARLRYTDASSFSPSGRA